MTERRRYGLVERAGIKWLLDSRNVIKLEIALLNHQFEVIPPTEEEVVNYDNRIKRFSDYKKGVVIVETSKRLGYQIVTWTKACDALIADEFGGFKPFIRAQQQDMV